MKILLVSSYLPYPLYSGGNVRLYNLIKYLSQDHDITLICEKRDNQTEEDIEEVEKICHKVITVNRKKQWSLSNIFKTGLARNPFLLVGHTLPEMKKLIEEELARTQYDLIHVETFYVLQNVPATSVPLLLVEHNIEYIVYERFAKKSPFFLRTLLFWDIAKIKRAEQRAWKRSTHIATVSDEDRKVIGLANTSVIPNGVDLEAFIYTEKDHQLEAREQKILYIGDFKWVQNTDAATYIVSKVWPKILQKLKSENLKFTVKLWLVGRNMPESLKKLGEQESTIIFDDTNSQETPDIFSEATLLLAPKWVGGGTSYKILEAMAVGTPVVTTPLGLEGLAISADDVSLGENEEELAENVVELLHDQKKYSMLARKGREKVEQYYDWQMIGKRLHELYLSLVC